MTKISIIAKLAAETGMNKQDVHDVVEGFLDAVKESFKNDDSLEIRGFGTFHVVKRAARTARNPKTGAAVKVPARKLPVFKPSKELKKLV